ncbi:MAG: hypothetical protein OEY49_07925, partial [Candidatus Heimdallarchaeota archaeon]|nr:hypothetical protein [Candidatus Heimdallarchaeota archaeon]
MKKINLVFLQILIIMLGGMFNNTLQTTATSHPYSVDVDDIFGYYVEMAAADNVPGIQFGDNALMLPSNYTAIRIESLPDWGIDPNEGLNITGFTFDGNYSLSYTTPWDADYSQPVNGPPIYWPVLPMGDHTAHFDANTHMSATSTSTEMTVTYTNGTVGNPGYYTATIVYDLSNNLMQSYEVIGNIYFDMDQGYKDVEFRLTLAFKLQPGVSNAHWSTTSVTMVYSVDQAGDPL